MAAGPTDDPVMAAAAPDGHKSLLALNGRPAVSYLVDNLKGCDRVNRVILVSDRRTYEAAPNADVFVEAGQGETAGLMAGVRAADGAGRCLVMTGDMPLASSDAISDLLSRAPDADVVYPIVERSDLQVAFPDRAVTYVKAREGHFTGSSCLLFRPEVAISRHDMLESLMNARRDPKALVGMIGPVVALRMMFSTLSLAEYERCLSDALGIDCRVLVTRFPELLVSIDSPGDVALMEQRLPH